MHRNKQVVAHILPFAAIGGTELATLRIARAVEREGIESVMFCRADAPVVSRFFADEGFKTVVYDPYLFWRGNLIDRCRFIIGLAREFRRHKADIVHCADLLAGDLAAIAAKLTGRKLVCHVRNRSDWMERYRRAWIFLVDRLVFVSKDTRRHFSTNAKELAYCARRSGCVVYDGFKLQDVLTPQAVACIRQEVRSEFGIPPEAPIMGMVARFARQKDHLTLIDAAERVLALHPNARLLLVGGSLPEQQEQAHAQIILDRIAASSVRDRIVHTGFRTDVERLLDAMDIFVLCTHYEGLPLVLLEAMAHGRPVVATAVDGIPEVVIDGHTGLLHRPRDADDLAAKLTHLLQSEELSRTLGAAGASFVAQNFSDTRFAEDVTRLYQDLLKPASARAAKLSVMQDGVS